jgi:hypothetical protein
MGIGGANSSEFACGVARSGSPQGAAQPRLRVKQRLLRVEALTGAGEKKILCPTSAVFEREDLRTVAAFLVGFEIFRMADGRTYGHRDSSWEKNIYCYLHQ